jgi:hypothetical protein
MRSVGMHADALTAASSSCHGRRTVRATVAATLARPSFTVEHFQREKPELLCPWVEIVGEMNLCRSRCRVPPTYRTSNGGVPIA